MSVSKMIDKILEHEGGYIDHPNDRGRPTNYGITQRTLSAYLGRVVTPVEVENLDINLAREIYAANYFKGPRLDQLPDDTQLVMFDMSVNHGPRNAIKILQRVLAQAGIVERMEIDGVAGPQTFAAARTGWQKMKKYLINAIVDERINFFNAIVARDPSQQVFLRGWINRAKTFYVEV